MMGEALAHRSRPGAMSTGAALALHLLPPA